MIQVENLTKRYGATTAVDDVSFTVNTGEILGFLGPNGAGKTTTMKILTCFMPATQGRITIDSMDVFDRSLEVRRRIGYLPESAPLYTDMNVTEYLCFVAGIRGIPKNELKSRLDNIVNVCGLTEVRRKEIGELSKGFKQRVGLAQAMIHNPDILILDEPTSGLDPNQIVEIRNLIKQLGEEKTVILSTHILPEVQATCDRVLIISRGKLVADGTPNELTSQFHGDEQIQLAVSGTTPDLLRSALTALPGIAWLEVTPGKEMAVRITAERGMDLREPLFRCIVDQGWTLLELHRERTSLEQVFRQLTGAEAKSHA
jgi:ABC-2 type transport system ATP-binding protein